jgi:thiol-disulfide isomerase/thioredoxin
MKFTLLLMAYSLLLSASPLSLKKLPDFNPQVSVNIVVFYASWCPPCQRTLTLMRELTQKDKQVYVSLIDIKDPHSLQVAKEYGLGENIPYILIADQSGMIMKRFEAIPDKAVLKALIERVEEGRLENGTLPIDKRIDTWNMKRKGM